MDDPVPKEIDKKLNEFMRTLPSEELYFEAVREIVKDVIKEYIRHHINQHPELKEALADALKEFIEAKIKEYDSMAKMAKVTASIGLTATPKSIKDEALSDFLDVFQKEIEDIIKKTI